VAEIVPYDKLVIAVGSESMTHGVEGLEHCNFLKSIADARDIRRKVVENFEKASLPTTTDEERRQLLSFVICGGGNVWFFYCEWNDLGAERCV
jgi:NADH dehydrogenase